MRGDTEGGRVEDMHARCYITSLDFLRCQPAWAHGSIMYGLPYYLPDYCKIVARCYQFQRSSRLQHIT